MGTLRNECTRPVCRLMVAGTLAVATPAAADVVTDRKALAVLFTGVAGRPPGAAVDVDLAMVHIAIHDAVQAYQHRFRTCGPPVPTAARSPVAPAAAAAHGVLVARFQIPSVNAGLIPQVEVAYTNDLTGKGLAINDAGVAVGQQAAMNIVLNRAGDGFFPANSEIVTGCTEPGQRRPTPPGFAVDGDAVARQRDAVRAEGRRGPAARGAASVGEPGVGADSAINSWNNKRTYSYWRPARRS